jgi:chromosome segregation ATPase
MSGESISDEALSRLRFVAAQRRQWGKNLSLKDFNSDELLDDLVKLVAVFDAEHIEDVQEELTLSNRQLGAAKARETKLREDLKTAQEEIASLQAHINDLTDNGEE